MVQSILLCFLILLTSCTAWLPSAGIASFQTTDVIHNLVSPSLTTIAAASSSWIASDEMENSIEMMDSISPLLVVAVALTIGIAAQILINQMLRGDQGLGAFLNDGSGFNRSGFSPKKGNNDSDDPLPWLKLPRLDFVEVAGQQSKQEELYTELEETRAEMNVQLQQGNVQEATALRNKLESLMRQNGIEFEAE